MKLKGSFDAKRLRQREPRNWGARLAAGLSALVATLGVLLAMAGVAGLLGNYSALAELNANRPLSVIPVVVGLLLLYRRALLAPQPDSPAPRAWVEPLAAPDEKHD